MVELGTVWLLMMVLNQGGPAYLTADMAMDSFTLQDMMTVKITTVGKVAMDLRPGQEKIWSDVIIREPNKPDRHVVVIIRFDTGQVIRLNPEKKTYAVKPLPKDNKLLAEIRDIYLGGADGKARAQTIAPPAGGAETRIVKQVRSDSYTTTFYVEPAKQNAVTRVDVSANNTDFKPNRTNFAVIESLTNVSLEAVPESRFMVPENQNYKPE